MPDRKVTFTTNKGVIVAQLFEAQAPITTANFIGLVQTGFYNGLGFHRYEPGFVLQGGDPLGNGTGNSGKTIKLEVSPSLKHDSAGVLAMARSPNPDSASCQFYFTLASTPHLDGSYAVFGKVTQGLDILQQLRKGDIMKSVTIGA